MPPPNQLPEVQIQLIRDAVRYLEKPSFLMRVADLVGRPIEGIAALVIPDRVAQISHDALLRLVKLTIWTLPTALDQEFDFSNADTAASWHGFWSKFSVAVTGCAGGAFGLTGLAIELPISTGIMFRSIAATGQKFGENMSDPAVHLECLNVFSMGGSRSTEAMESSYLTTRLAMAEMIREAAKFLARESAATIADAIARETAPVLIKLISQVGARFNIVVTEKLVAHSLPAIGAATGALINVAFCDHFNTVARFHFGIRELERRVGAEIVQQCYRGELARISEVT